jgi:hypothetical protein
MESMHIFSPFPPVNLIVNRNVNVLLSDKSTGICKKLNISRNYAYFPSAGKFTKEKIMYEN